MTEVKHLTDVPLVKYSQVQFDVFAESERYRLSIPQSLDNRDAIHTRLRVFNPQDGKPLHFSLYGGDTYLGDSYHDVLDIGALVNHKLVKAAVDSAFSRSYNYYGANLNRIDNLNLRLPQNTKYPSLIVVAEMMST